MMQSNLTDRLTLLGRLGDGRQRVNREFPDRISTPVRAITQTITHNYSTTREKFVRPDGECLDAAAVEDVEDRLEQSGGIDGKAS